MERRIVAYPAGEGEARTVRNLIKAVVETEAFLIGIADDVAYSNLQTSGILFDDIEAVQSRELNGPYTAAVGPPNASRSKGAGGGPKRANARDVYLLRLMGPLLDEHRQQLETLGIPLIEYIPVFRYKVLLTFKQIRSLKGLSFVHSIERFAALRSPRPSLRIKGGESTKSSFPETICEIKILAEADSRTMRQWLEQNNVTILGQSERRFKVAISSEAALSDLSDNVDVEEIQEFLEPEIFNDHVRRIINADLARCAGASLDGNGQIIAIADTGVDREHPDLKGRFVSIIALGRDGDASDPDGHGTHVAGIAVGNGTASQGKFKGVAPKAHLVFQSLLSANGRLGGLPVSTADLLKQAFDLGARIHSNSWGTATSSNYALSSDDVDYFVSNHRDMLVVVAAGNEGQAAERLNSQPGFVDWLSIASPATAKNAIAVGASRSDRREGGYSKRTYKAQWPTVFPDPPTASETISGQPSEIAAFSSRGPSTDRRIKPDLVAPGTDILSTKSDESSDERFWGGYDRFYAFLGGTSMAAPAVAGAAALARQYLRDIRKLEPSASLLRAVLINGCAALDGLSSLADHSNVPNNHQGFGRLDLSRSIPLGDAPTFDLLLVDNWKDMKRQLLGTGRTRRFSFRVKEACEIRACLCWIDPAGRSVQNQLGLMIEGGNPISKAVGNSTRSDRLGIFDMDNNVQVIRVAVSQPGDYIVSVRALNLLRTPQDFSLAITCLTSDGTLTEI